MALVDSHAHLDMKEFDKDRNQVVERAFEKGIRAILCPSDITNFQSLQNTFSLTETYDNIIAAAGVHPHQAKNFSSDCIRKIEELAAAKKIYAVGEIGLDFHYSFSPSKTQIKAFRHQLNIAQELKLPVVVHSRKAGAEVALAVKEENFSRGGVLHCFSEDWELAKRMMNLNFFISFSGILTFLNAQPLREVAKKVPLERLLVETDSPYLAPTPYRGTRKRNEPAYMIETAKILAELKNVSLDKLGSITSQNFESLFMFEIKDLRC
ncbi:MAG: TatD family hydrolase [Candidatus Aminicenantes bacterium]|nr:MAG: TatD family hydrolase [Candidatus Aminicenantes bacterium]